MPRVRKVLPSVSRRIDGLSHMHWLLEHHPEKFDKNATEAMRRKIEILNGYGAPRKTGLVNGMSYDQWLRKQHPEKYHNPAFERLQKVIMDREHPLNKKVVRTFGGNAFDDWMRTEGLDPSEFRKTGDKSTGVRHVGSVKRKSTFTKDLDDSDDEEYEGGDDDEEGAGFVDDILGDLTGFIDGRSSGRSGRGRGKTARGGRKINRKTEL